MFYEDRAVINELGRDGELRYIDRMALRFLYTRKRWFCSFLTCGKSVEEGSPKFSSIVFLTNQ